MCRCNSHDLTASKALSSQLSGPVNGCHPARLVCALTWRSLSSAPSVPNKQRCLAASSPRPHDHREAERPTRMRYGVFLRCPRQARSNQISSKSVVVELAPASDGRGLMRSTVMKSLRPPLARAASASAALWLAAASLAAAACGGSHCSFHAQFWTIAASRWVTDGDNDTAARHLMGCSSLKPNRSWGPQRGWLTSTVYSKVWQVMANCGRPLFLPTATLLLCKTPASSTVALHFN